MSASWCSRATKQAGPFKSNPKGRPLPACHSLLPALNRSAHVLQRAPRLAGRQGPSRPQIRPSRPCYDKALQRRMRAYIATHAERLLNQRPNKASCTATDPNKDSKKNRKLPTKPANQSQANQHEKHTYTFGIGERLAEDFAGDNVAEDNFHHPQGPHRRSRLKRIRRKPRHRSRSPHRARQYGNTPGLEQRLQPTLSLEVHPSPKPQRLHALRHQHTPRTGDPGRRGLCQQHQGEHRSGQ